MAVIIQKSILIMNYSIKSIYNTVDFLKFPLAVLVVILHSNITCLNIGGEIFPLDCNHFPIYRPISFLFSELIASLAVPTFFVISGYFFFNGLITSNGTLNSNIYIEKLKRRTKTLLLPYLLWNLIYLLIFFVGQSIFSDIMSDGNKRIADYELLDYLNVFWSGYHNYSICAPLWFVRNLMVMILLAPIFVFLFRKTKCTTLILFLFVWLLELGAIVDGIDFKSLFFFYGGGYVSYNKFNMKVLMQKKWFFVVIYILVDLFLMFFCVDNDDFFSRTIQRLSLILGVPTLIIIGIFISNEFTTNKCIRFLNQSNFFIFSYHFFPLGLIMKLFLVIFKPQTDFTILFIYFSCPVIVVLIGLLLFYFIKNIAPKVAFALTGGRM